MIIYIIVNVTFILYTTYCYYNSGLKFFEVFIEIYIIILLLIIFVLIIWLYRERWVNQFYTYYIINYLNKNPNLGKSYS